MHIDEKKRYDKRTLERDLREGVISQKEVEEYLAKLPDAWHKVFPGRLNTIGKKDNSRTKREAFVDHGRA